MTTFLNSNAFLLTDPAVVLWLDVTLKATLLLLLAGGVNGLLRRGAAAVRHRVWCLAFCGLLGLPLLTTLLPAPTTETTITTNASKPVSREATPSAAGGAAKPQAAAR